MKRTIALLLALLFCLPLVACGNTGSGDTTTTGAVADATTTPETDAQTEVNALNILGPRDCGKETVTFYSRVYNGVWISDLFVESMTGDTLGDAIYRRNANIEANYNVKLAEIKSNAQAFGDKVESMVKAGNTDYDILYMGLTDSANCAAKGLLIDFNDIENVDLDGPWWSQSSNAAWSIGHRQFFAIGDISTIDNMAIRCMYFNKKTVTDYQLESPHELVKKNEWTFDKFFELANSVGTDEGGDGVYNVSDSYGAVAQTTFGFMMLMASGELITKKNNDDIPVLALSTEADRSTEVIDYLTSHIASNNHIYLGDDKDIMSIFSTGRSLFMAEVLQHAKTMRQYDIVFGIIPMPKYNTDQTDYYQYTTGYCTTVVCFPTTTTGNRLDLSSFILEAMAIESVSTVTPAYYDICLKTRYSEDVESSAMIDIICESVASDLAEIYAWAGLKSSLQDAISSGRSVNTLIKSNKSVFERIVAVTVKAYADAKSVG